MNLIRKIRCYFSDRTKKPIPNTKLEMLQTIISHFGKNPKELRASIRSPYGGGEECLYNNITEKIGNIGCAIGMFIPNKDCLKLTHGISDILLDGNKFRQRELIPNQILAFGEEFLMQIQNLHDNAYNWNLESNKGLLLIGIENVKKICNNNGIDFNLLKLT